MTDSVFAIETGCTDHKPGDVLSYMKDRQMPTTLAQMNISQDQFIDSIRQGLSIMERRNRYSVMKHLEVDDDSLKAAMAELGY